jgi:phenylalanyl-tRNA synthetase beta chain
VKILLSWLNDFAPFGTDHLAVAEAMDALGLAVDGIEVVGAPIDGVVTAKVLERAKHPNADRIGLVFVDTGNGESLQICCGAFNMQPGDVVPLATIGTVMPDGRPIQRSKMRGEWSNGMLCSARELGLGEDHGGILILPADTPLGVPVFDAMGISHDVVFDLDLTRNRPDCWGHVGVARDLAARSGCPSPSRTRPSTSPAPPAASPSRSDHRSCAGVSPRPASRV